MGQTSIMRQKLLGKSHVVLAVIAVLAALCMLTCLIPPHARADALQVGDSGVPVQETQTVYDSVYGVFGGEYALMMQGVELGPSDESIGGRFGNCVYDVVNASGQVTLHTSWLSASCASQPGGWTDLGISNFGRLCDDVDAGYVKVKSKTTGCYGVYGVTGEQLVPCIYERIELCDGGTCFAGLRADFPKIHLGLYGIDGAELGSVDIAATRTDGALDFLGLGSYADDSVFAVNIWEWYKGEDDQYDVGDTGVVFRKQGGGYVVDDRVARVYNANEEGVAWAGLDGTCYVRTSSGIEADIGPAADVKSVDVSYDGAVCLELADGSEAFYVPNASGELERTVGDWTGEGALVIRDGFYYFVSRDTPRIEAKLAAVQDCMNARLENGLAFFDYEDGDGAVYTMCYTTAGKELARIVEVADSSSEEGVLAVLDDGSYYFITPDGAKVKLISSDGVWDAGFDGAFAWFECEDAEGDYDTRYFATNGTELVGEHFDTCDSHALFEVGGDDPCNYVIYDAQGRVAASFKAQEVSHLLVSRGMDGDVVDFYYTVNSLVNGNESNLAVDDDGEETYSMSVYNLGGTLMKEIGEVASPASRLDAVGDSPTCGYRLKKRYSATGANVYYDLNFVGIDHCPTERDYEAVKGTGSDSGDDSKSLGAPSYTLPDGTGLYLDRKTVVDNGIAVTDADGNSVTIGAYTLSVYVNPSTDYSSYNSLRRGDSDIWWARDETGKWGAVSSAGEVVVPFEYAGYRDGGYENTDYALVLKDGLWGFVNVVTGEVRMVGDAGTQGPIAPASIEGATVEVASQTYTGAALSPQVTVKIGGETLPADAYSVSCPEAVNAGNYPVAVSGVGAYGGMAMGTFTVSRARLGGADVTGVLSQTYAGKPIEQPKLAVRLGGVLLNAVSDYKVSYTSNVNAGRAWVTVSGVGNYTGKVEKAFSIGKAAISKASVAKIRNQRLKRAGKAVKPKVKLAYKGATLKKGRDYTLTYKKNKKRGKAQVVIKGKGNFKGKKTVRFKIV